MRNFLSAILAVLVCRIFSGSGGKMLDPTKFHELEAIEAHLQWLTKRFPDQVSMEIRPFLI